MFCFRRNELILFLDGSQILERFFFILILGNFLSGLLLVSKMSSILMIVLYFALSTDQEHNYRWHIPRWLCLWWINCSPQGLTFDKFHCRIFLFYNFFFPFWFLKACIYNFFMVVQYFKENPDNNNPAFNTKYGAYSEGCGLDNVLMSWGHDDYMYLVKFCKTFYWKIKLCFFYLFQWHHYRGSLYSGS